MYEYVIYYQKKDGTILERKRTTLPDNKVGEYTSMGWLIKDIKYCLDEKLYDSYSEYMAALKKKYRSKNELYKLKKVIKSHTWEIIVMIYLTIVLVSVNA